ncbi:MAG TPA: antibiotic biosynthesis monooxygenase [Polyangiaceae bacterium]|nr:antibiotic biosynthesis monooxygenase [Polyangiaceae bacterium]
MAVRVGLVVRLVAKAGKEEELAKFLASAAPLAAAEAFTPAWFALRTEPAVFYIVDAFAGEADRDKHLSGEIAKALMARADELLAEPHQSNEPRFSARNFRAFLASTRTE